MAISRRRFLKYALAAMVGAPAAGGGYAFGLEPAWLQVTHTDIALPSLPPAFAGFRIALVSDLHYGAYLPIDRLRRVVRMVNDLAVDLIAFGGDFVSEPRSAAYLRDRVLGQPLSTFRQSPAAEAVFGVCIPLVAQMRARLGSVAVLGNHDHWVDAAVGRRYLAEHGIPLLENRHVIFDQDEAQLVVAGVGDLWEGVQDLPQTFAGAPPAEIAPRILLSHNPDFAVDPEVGRHGIRLMLSGHTHGGQVYVPGIGSPILPIQHKQFVRGLAPTAWGQVYISRGIGSVSPPLRVLTRPEIAVLRLI